MSDEHLTHLADELRHRLHHDTHDSLAELIDAADAITTRVNTLAEPLAQLHHQLDWPTPTARHHTHQLLADLTDAADTLAHHTRTLHDHLTR